LSLDAPFKRGIDARPTELLALRDRALEASVDALTDMLRSNSAKARGGIDRLLIEVQIDAALQRLR
jgi:hypothetical protein